MRLERQGAAGCCARHPVGQRPVDLAGTRRRPAAAKDYDPCQLVTQGEAETLAGTPLLVGVLSEGGGDKSCTFGGPTTGPLAQVEVYLGDGALKFLDIERTLGHDVVPLEGIGDEAYSEEFAIFARQGDTWVAIHLVRLDEPEPYRQGLEDLARTVISRL